MPRKKNREFNTLFRRTDHKYINLPAGIVHRLTPIGRYGHSAFDLRTATHTEDAVKKFLLLTFFSQMAQICIHLFWGCLSKKPATAIGLAHGRLAQTERRTLARAVHCAIRNPGIDVLRTEPRLELASGSLTIRLGFFLCSVLRNGEAERLFLHGQDSSLGTSAVASAISSFLSD